MGRRSAYAVSSGALLAAVALVGGCTSTPEPTPTTSSPAATTPAPSSTTPSPTASSPSPSASGIPAAAKVKSEAGAIAFVKYYFSQVNLAWTTPDPALLDGLAHKDCISCASNRGEALRMKTEGHRYTRDPATVVGIRPTKSPPGHLQLDMTMRQNKAQEVDSSGKIIEDVPEETASFIVDLVWKEERWVVWGIA